jgi:hypothetical protein
MAPIGSNLLTTPPPNPKRNAMSIPEVSIATALVDTVMFYPFDELC